MNYRCQGERCETTDSLVFYKYIINQDAYISIRCFYHFNMMSEYAFRNYNIEQISQEEFEALEIFEFKWM